MLARWCCITCTRNGALWLRRPQGRLRSRQGGGLHRRGVCLRIVQLRRGYGTRVRVWLRLRRRDAGVVRERVSRERVERRGDDLRHCGEVFGVRERLVVYWRGGSGNCWNSRMSGGPFVLGL